MVVGILIAVTTILVLYTVFCVWNLVRRRNIICGQRSIIRNILFPLVSIIMVIIIAGLVFLSSYLGASIDSLFLRGESCVKEDDADETTWKAQAVEIAEEGFVLLKNEDQALPLESGKKINLLGYKAYDPYYASSGSGRGSAADAVSTKDALEAAGFTVNPAPEDAGIYKTAGKADKSLGMSVAKFSIDEIGPESFTGDASFEAMAEYSDVAVLVFGRTGGEATDLTDYDEGDYLSLSAEEEALLKKSCETFGKVIVVFNTPSAFNMESLQPYDVDAIIWTGLPGAYGFTALGEILAGTVNPSGHLPDIWAMNASTAPARANFGVNKADNAKNSYYVDYVEGIYVGYRWYETAYEEKAVIQNTITGEKVDYSDYDNVVCYPFGYGLSYTEFEQSIESVSDAKLDPYDELTFHVQVKNTGSVEGKSAVQLYASKPYTEYDMENGIEKSAVELIGYAKTGMLKPGESEAVTITVQAEDLASYDTTYLNSDGTNGTYVLEAGNYTFSVRSDSHTVLDTANIPLEETTYYSGDGKRPSDYTAAENAFDGVARGEYLSRKDGFSNYADAMACVSSTLVSTDWETTDELYDEAYDEAVTKQYVEGVDYGVKGSLTVDDLRGAAIDDERWDQLVAQMSIEDMQTLIGDALYKTRPIKSIGKVGTQDADGPMGISSLYNLDAKGVAYPGVPILAATFNNELATKLGKYIAQEAHKQGVTGWYAPGMNLHRTPYSGRNNEYYSEDTILSSGMAAAEVSGARSENLLVYIKHYALNDQESKRDKRIHTYATEQTIRELYLRPFEHAIKDGGTNAVMASMNYVGDVFAGGHAGLFTQTLREEWGFTGMTITDMDMGGEGKSIYACLRAGIDMWLSVVPAGFHGGECSNADIYYLQRASKNILYAQSQSMISKATVFPWRICRNLIIGSMGVLIITMIAQLVIRHPKKKKKIMESKE